MVDHGLWIKSDNEKYLQGLGNKSNSGVKSSMIRSLTPLVKKLRNYDSGVTAIEYALIAALIAIVIVASLTLVGTDLGTMLDNFSKNLAN